VAGVPASRLVELLAGDEELGPRLVDGDGFQGGAPSGYALIRWFGWHRSQM
jgi:hypothetical protein